MNSTFKRREFLIKSTRAGVVCCGILLCPCKVNAYMPGTSDDDQKPNPGKLNYCGYICPEDCPFLKGTIENNIDLKKQAYEQWKIKERYDADFEEDKIFCYGCKADGKPEGIVLKHCTVRSCAIEKGYDCCIECAGLVDCDKDLWTRFPDFKVYMIDLQKKYNAD